MIGERWGVCVWERKKFGKIEIILNVGEKEKSIEVRVRGKYKWVIFYFF